MTLRSWCAIALVTASLHAAALPTDITVHVIAKDAKFIGTDMGGVRVTIADADTGELLAQGVTSGGVGDSERILERPRRRGVPIATEDAAAYRATIDIERPTRVEVSAFGPLVYPAAANRVSSTQWVVPGRHITGGDGWLLEMPGFFVQITPFAAPVTLGGGHATVPVVAKVVMMCGCATSPGGVWDSARYEIEGSLVKSGRTVAHTTLSPSGNASEYAGALGVSEAGVYEAVVYAYDPANGNTGVARSSVLVVP